MELSTVEAAAAIGVSDDTIRNHIAAGRLLAHKRGVAKAFKIKVDDLRAYARQYNYVIDEEYLATLARKQTAN